MLGDIIQKLRASVSSCKYFNKHVNSEKLKGEVEHLSEDRNACHSGNISFHLVHCVAPGKGQVVHLERKMMNRSDSKSFFMYIHLSSFVFINNCQLVVCFCWTARITGEKRHTNQREEMVRFKIQIQKKKRNCLFKNSLSLFCPRSNRWQLWGEQVQEVLLGQVHLGQQSPIWGARICQGVLARVVSPVTGNGAAPFHPLNSCWQGGTPTWQERHHIIHNQAYLCHTSACSNVFTVWMDSWSWTFSLTILQTKLLLKLSEFKEKISAPVPVLYIELQHPTTSGWPHGQEVWRNADTCASHHTWNQRITI